MHLKVSQHSGIKHIKVTFPYQRISATRVRGNTREISYSFESRHSSSYGHSIDSRVLPTKAYTIKRQPLRTGKGPVKAGRLAASIVTRLQHQGTHGNLQTR